MKRRIKEKLVDQHPEKYGCFKPPKTNPQNQRIDMLARLRSNKRRDSTSDEIGSSSPCDCIAEKIMKIEDPREKWFDAIKAHLDNECYVHEKNCPNNSVIADYTSLHNAVREDNENMVKLLLKNKTCVDSKSKFELTPLHIAVHRGNLRIAEILLSHGASVDSKFTLGEHSCVPLDLAIQGRDKSMVKLLLSHEANDDSKKNYNWRPLRFFHSNENFEAINTYLLMSHLDRGNKNRKTSLLDTVEASMLEYQKVVRYLLNVCSNIADITIIVRELIHYAVERGFIKVVEDLLIWGADIGIIHYRAYPRHIQGLTLLHTAVKYNRNDIVKLLINHGADVNAKDLMDKNPILYAFEKNNAKMIKLLLSNGAHKNKSPDLLHTAVKMSKSSEIIEILLQNGSDVNYPDDLERTPLHLAVTQAKSSNTFSFVFLVEEKRFSIMEDNSEYSTKNNVKIIKMLLRHGADVNARDNNCYTPLHIAAQVGNFEAVNTLLEHYANDDAELANIDAIGEYRATALISAAEMGHEKIVEILFKFGADINFKREDGKTALIRATEKGHEKVVQILLEHNADIEATSYVGLTALDFAFKRLSSFNVEACTKIIMLLLNSGADVEAVNLLNSSMCSCVLMPVFLKQHIVKMKAASMCVDEKKFESIINSLKLSYFRRVCEEEVEKLKNEKIGKSNVSLYDILTKGPHRLAIICRNRQIVKALESKNYKKKFPIYSKMIENNFNKGQKRQVLQDRALCSFNCLTGYEFPNDLSADMLRYLSNEDLKNLEEASD